MRYNLPNPVPNALKSASEKYTNRMLIVINYYNIVNHFNNSGLGRALGPACVPVCLP